ncbi:MAG TPA: hypothetical protein VGN26_02280 [Armatimonadota bacterium]|jgi:hypothetical protein
MLKLRSPLVALLALLCVGAVTAKAAEPKPSAKATMDNLVQGIQKGDKTKVLAQFDWEAMASDGGATKPEEAAQMIPLTKTVFSAVLMGKDLKSLKVDAVKVKGDQAEATTQRLDAAGKKVAGPTFTLKRKDNKWLIVGMGSPASAAKGKGKEDKAKA